MKPSQPPSQTSLSSQGAIGPMRHNKLPLSVNLEKKVIMAEENEEPDFGSNLFD